MHPSECSVNIYEILRVKDHLQFYMTSSGNSVDKK